ncbi:MAG: hypothetical protein JRC60_07700 [Deltaproteobacteria bacterium]|nr:hypothetical protein [Deltaproteobacteria bacterium]
MKVIYTDPNGAAGTYHPKLGYLKSGKPFELSADVAGEYIKSGLLTKIEKKKAEVKDNGKSIDR